MEATTLGKRPVSSKNPPLGILGISSCVSKVLEMLEGYRSDLYTNYYHCISQCRNDCVRT